MFIGEPPVKSKSFPAAGNNEPSSSAVTRVGHPTRFRALATRRILDPSRSLSLWILGHGGRIPGWTVFRKEPAVLRNNLEPSKRRRDAVETGFVVPRVFRIRFFDSDTSFRCDTFVRRGRQFAALSTKPEIPAHDRYLGASRIS